MVIITLGLTGLVFLFLYDLATLQRLRGRQVLAAVGYALHGLSICGAALAGEKLTLPAWGVGLGWLVFLLGTSWLLYSLFLFVPIGQTYREEEGPQLTTGGPYAFARHPGVIGHAAMIVGLILGSRSGALLTAGPI